MNRREFLKGTAWMGAAAFAAGCQLNRFGFGEGVSVASGESAKNELCGAQGIAIFKDEVTL